MVSIPIVKRQKVWPFLIIPPFLGHLFFVSLSINDNIYYFTVSSWARHFAGSAYYWLRRGYPSPCEAIACTSHFPPLLFFFIFYFFLLFCINSTLLRAARWSTMLFHTPPPIIIIKIYFPSYLHLDHFFLSYHHQNNIYTLYSNKIYFIFSILFIIILLFEIIFYYYYYYYYI